MDHPDDRRPDPDDRDRYVTRQEFVETLDEIHRNIHRLKERSMGQQADVDAIAVELGQVSTDIDDAVTVLQAEIDALANKGVDTSSLQVAADALDPKVKALANIVPTPPSV